MSLRDISVCLLNTFRDRDSTTFLGIPFQCLTTVSMKKFFQISCLNLLWCNLRPLPHSLSLSTREKITRRLNHSLTSLQEDKVTFRQVTCWAPKPRKFSGSCKTCLILCWFLWQWGYEMWWKLFPHLGYLWSLAPMWILLHLIRYEGSLLTRST